MLLSLLGFYCTTVAVHKLLITIHELLSADVGCKYSCGLKVVQSFVGLPDSNSMHILEDAVTAFENLQFYF